jgi:nucleotide-binding universal stress UspA family protein
VKLIVALVDFSRVTSDLVTLAGSMARAVNSRLILLHVAMPDAEFVDGNARPDSSRDGIASGLRRRHRDLEILQLELKKIGVDALCLMVRGESPRGNPARKIVEELNRLEPDLILMGAPASGRFQQFLGRSLSDTIIRKVRRPLLLVPNNSAVPGSHREPSRGPR